MEILKAVVSSVIPLVANVIIEPAVYPFTIHGNIRDLESATSKLRTMKDDVKIKITNAERKNDAPTNQAQEWLIHVEIIEKEVEEIQQKYQQLFRCIWNISPNVYAIYKVSRSAAKKHVEVNSLCDKKATLEVTMHMPKPLAQEMPASSSISSTLESVLHCIRYDVCSNIIGIWGMGGVGKTHLLEQINNELSKDPAYEVVVFVTCSKDCSEENVQNKMIDKLGLSKSDSREQKQITIYNFLREKSFVLLLDDVWSRVDLKTIGIPDPMKAVSTCKRKVLLTTRSTDVCGQMEVKKKIKVNVLNWEDAWSLFKEKVTEEIIDSDPLIQKYALDVAKELGGLPLALITIGRAMHDKVDPREWEQAVVLLKQACLNDVEFTYKNQSTFHILKFSYDSLKNDAIRQCFLHCSLWPEDYQIEKDDLIELWIGLGLIDEPKIQAAYNIGHCYIRRLQAVCLLEIGDDDNTLKIHDVIRDMALWIVNNQGNDTKKWIVQAGQYKGTQEQEIEVSGDTEKLSIMKSNASKFSSSITRSSTKLSTLLLSNNSIEDSKTLRLDLFSKLTFLDLSWNLFEAFPIEICELGHLKFLNLSYNWDLETLLPEEFGALTNLKYLLLRGTPCTFPNNVLSKLKALRVLDLSTWHTNRKFQVFQALQEDLQCLSNFGALGITINSAHDFCEFSQKVCLPVRWFAVCCCNINCLSFSSCFLGNSRLQSNLISIYIGGMDSVECVKFESTTENQNICHLERLELLLFSQMRNMKTVIWKSLNPKDVFPRLQTLIFGKCNNLTCISWIVNLPCIRILKLFECTSMKQLIRTNELVNSGIEVIQYSFPFLKTMVLRENYGMERISDPTVTFPALELLAVCYCHKLKKLPFQFCNPPRKLKLIRGDEKWWNNIEMEDGGNKSFLEPFFKKW